jgi:tetratricopeptide (TPR) repeat protein
LQELAKAFPRNYIFPLEIASLHRAAEDYPAAIRGYEHVLEWVREGKEGFADAPVARIHYELGDLYRKNGNLENALQHLKQVKGAQGSNPALEQESALLQQQVEDELQRREVRSASAGS